MTRYLSDSEIQSIMRDGNENNTRMDSFRDEIRILYEHGHHRYYTLVFILNLFNLRFIDERQKKQLVKFMNSLYKGGKK